MEATWSLLRNTFDNVTKFNFKRMFLMARDHRDKLKTQANIDSDITPIYEAFILPFNHFEQVYNEVGSNFAQYQSATQQFEEKLAELSHKYIKKWDLTIQMELDDDTATYKSLLPNGRAPFQSGAYDLRLSAVYALILNLQKSGSTTLISLAQNIQIWYNEANAIRTQQQGIEQVDAILRQNLEDARTELAVEMHTTFFKLCVLYSRNLAKVETFYELKYLKVSIPKKTTKKNPNTEKDIHILPIETITIQQNIKEITQEFSITNTGNEVIAIWSTNKKESLAPLDAMLIYPQQTIYFSIDEVADSSGIPTLLRAYNKSTKALATLKLGINKKE